MSLAVSDCVPCLAGRPLPGPWAQHTCFLMFLAVCSLMSLAVLDCVLGLPGRMLLGPIFMFLHVPCCFRLCSWPCWSPPPRPSLPVMSAPTLEHCSATRSSSQRALMLRYRVANNSCQISYYYSVFIKYCVFFQEFSIF